MITARLWNRLKMKESISTQYGSSRRLFIRTIGTVNNQPHCFSKGRLRIQCLKEKNRSWNSFYSHKYLVVWFTVSLLNSSIESISENHGKICISTASKWLQNSDINISDLDIGEEYLTSYLSVGRICDFWNLPWTFLLSHKQIFEMFSDIFLVYDQNFSSSLKHHGIHWTYLVSCIQL